MAVVHRTTANLGKGPPVQPVPVSKTAGSSRRTEALRIRLSSVERAAVDATAEAAGLGPCSFARMVVVAAVGQKPTPPPPRRREPTPPARELAKVIAAINHVGNNLNQLARSANSGFDVDPAIIQEAIVELRALREAIVTASDSEAAP